MNYISHRNEMSELSRKSEGLLDDIISASSRSVGSVISSALETASSSTPGLDEETGSEPLVKDNPPRKGNDEGSRVPPASSSLSSSSSHFLPMGDCYAVGGSEAPVRDKSDNRQTHEISDCPQKSAVDGAGCEDSEGFTIFKPSSKIIELPEKKIPSTKSSSSSSHENHHHHHNHNHHHHTSHFRKESKIPVGIAVAWQRLVTSTTTTPTVTSAMTSKSEGNPLKASSHPSRPSSASPHHQMNSKGKGGSGKYNHSHHHSTSSSLYANGGGGGGGGGASAKNGFGSGVDSDISSRPLSACGDPGGGGSGGGSPFCPTSPLARPFPSSSVPPNLGYPYNQYPPQQHTHHLHRIPPQSPYFADFGSVSSYPSRQSPFAVPSPLQSPSSPHHHQHHHHPHFLQQSPYWAMQSPIENTPNVPLLSPGMGGGGAGGDYLQQLSMQQQLVQQHEHLLSRHSLSSSLSSSHSLPGSPSPGGSPSPYHPHPYLGFMYPAQEKMSPQAAAYYDHYFQQQQQQNELLRQQQQQLSVVNGSSRSSSSSSSQRAIPMEQGRGEGIPVLSPGQIRAPAALAHTCTVVSSSSSSSSVASSLQVQTPPPSSLPASSPTTSVAGTTENNNGGGMILSQTSSCSSSPSPSFLLHQQQLHPHLFTSSTAALSPKSLTSSTPSPVTVHDFNSGLNVVIGSSSSSQGTMLTSASQLRKCTTPSPSPISLTPRALLSPFGFSPSPVPMISTAGEKVSGKKGGSSSSGVPTPLSSPSQRHDFKRLESLIERRDCESISPLVLIPQHSPASTTSSVGGEKQTGDDDKLSLLNFPVKLENDDVDDDEQVGESRKVDELEDACDEKCGEVKGEEVKEESGGPMSDQSKGFSCDDNANEVVVGGEMSPVSEECPNTPRDQPSEIDERNQVPESNTLPSTESSSDYFPSFSSFKRDTTNQEEMSGIPEKKSPTGPSLGRVNSPKTKVAPPSFKVKKAKEKKAKPKKVKGAAEEKAKKKDKYAKGKCFEEKLPSKKPRKNSVKILDVPVVTPPEPKKPKKINKKTEAPSDLKATKGKKKDKKEASDKAKGKGKKDKTVEGVVVNLKKEKKSKKGTKTTAPETSLKQGIRQGTPGATNKYHHHHPIFPPSSGEGVASGSESDIRISERVLLHSTQPAAPPHPQQVTFLIAPESIRIPAYVPRSVVENNNAAAAASFHLGEDVGDDQGHEQTLTLHRDVEQMGLQCTFPQQPPAITIQYHHSAPATPATGFESPPFEYSIKPEENHLNLLATVAQEFGSREDLGSGSGSHKLLSSIDGSCNSSVIGESPPMSPQKSPFSSYIHHHRQPINQVAGPPTLSDLQQQEQLVLPPVPQKTPGKGTNKGSSSKVGKGKKERTANSITINGKGGVVRKAGKKEKRSASDSASYSPPSVVLKIPQILPSSRRLLPEEKERKKRKRKDKEQGVPGQAKVRRKNKGGIENESEPDKGEKKKKNKQRKSEENKKKGEGKGKGKARLLSPLKLQIGGEGEPTTMASKSPGGSSCFYNPPERISAFAKQVIARRDSSPTKPPGSSDTSPLKCSSQSAFFPTTTTKGTSSPPRMPRLIPYDDDEEQVPKVDDVSRVGGAIPPQDDEGIMEATSPEQDWTKTEFLDRSRIDRSKLNGNTIPEKKGSTGEGKEKKRPKPLTLLKPPEKLKKIRKERLVSIDERIRKKKKERLEKSLSILSSSLSQSAVESAVPAVKVTSPRVTPSSGSEGKLGSSFSPLTPPPTAKTVSTSDDGMSGSQTLSAPNRGPLSPGTETSRHSTPITVIDVETENEAEIDLANVWVADPLFAASAIKISSNQPSENEHGHHSDSSIFIVSDKEEEAAGGNPPKLTLMTSQSQNSDRVGEGEEEDDDHKRKFLEVKSQLKAFVHFKPKQLTSNKAHHHHHIKPCLKADPVVREDEELEEDELLQVDDEDFELDMEVAKLTTPSMKLPSPRKKGKKTINRNSSSYSSRKEKISTKEIMTKVFSRKLSPDLSSSPQKKKRRRSSAKKSRSRHTSPATASQEMDDADDEGGEEDDELPDIDSSHHPRKSHPEVAMSAAAAAVVVNSSSSSLLASPERMMMRKSPKKRSARSSTTSSCTSVKSSSTTNTRGNRGQMIPPSATSSSSASGQDETLTPGKVELDSVAELVDEMRILTEIQGLFYTGRLNALQPPDVYGVTLDNERGAPPHLIFSAEEVLEKCLREKKPHSLSPGMRISAYWSPQYSGLYPGRVSSEGFNPKFDPEQDLIPIEFDDGDTGMIKLKEIRLLSTNHPVREYDPNPLLTLEKKHRKRRHSSATATSGGCTGDHEEEDCGEPYCAKVGKLDEDEDDEDDDDTDANGRFTSTRGGANSLRSGSKMLYWTWSGLGYKRPKSKKNRNKEFFHGIQRGDEVLNVGDSALFISTGNERPFIGRVERFWEQKGKKMVNVRWFYHPEEVQASAKRLSNLKYPGALFESPHIDENDVQTIARKCDVLPFPDFRQRLLASSSGSPRLAKLSQKSSSKPRDMYYVAGFYDPYTYNLTLKDLK